MRIVLFIVAALIAAGGTGYYLFQQLAVESGTVVTVDFDIPSPASAEVFVPAKSMPAGTIITDEGLTRMRIETSAVTPEMVVADAAGPAFLIGGVARQALPEGCRSPAPPSCSPATAASLPRCCPRANGRSRSRSRDVRVSGLVLPGDRVDIILTYSVAAETATPPRHSGQRDPGRPTSASWRSTSG